MRKKSLLIKLIIFGSIVSIVPVVFVGAFSMIHSSNEIQKQNNVAQMQLIQQVNSNIEQIFLVADHTLTNLLESTVMDEAMHSQLFAEDFQMYNQLRKEINHLQSFDTKVNEVIVLNKREGWLIRNDGIKRLDEHPDSEQLMTYFALPNVSSWVLLRNHDFKEISHPASCSYTISAVRKLPHYRTDKYALAFLNIPACSIADMLYTEKGSDEIIIIDEQQQIVTHRDHTLIGTNLSEHPVFHTKISFTEPSGQFQLVENGRPYTITYHKSSLNNWIYLSVVSVDMLTKESRKIRLFTLTVGVITIAISMIFVWLISRNLYFPVNRLVQFISEKKSDNLVKSANEMQLIENYIEHLFSSKSKLEFEMRDHNQQAQTLFLSRLYAGALRPAEIEKKLQQFNWLDQICTWKSMTVLTLQVDTLGDTHYESKDLSLLLFAVSNIVDETIAKSERLPTVWFDQTLVILRGHSQNDTEEIKESDYTLTESLKEVIEHYLQLSVSIGISSIFFTISHASKAYEEGLEALRHRMILGKSVIIPYSSIQAAKPVVIHEYPARIENELIDAIKITNANDAKQLLESWMKDVAIGVLSPTDYQIYMMRLLNRLLLLKQEAGISFEQLGVYKSSLYDELLSLHMSEEIKEWFQQKVIGPLIKVFHERRKSQYHSLSEQMIDFIQKHVEDDITLESCAESMNYNASYLSSVFKNETGQLFSMYLAAYRLQVAKKWLVNTDMTIKEIAERLRYSNSHNFIRSFRKIEGITPGQYRLQNNQQ